MFGFIKTTFIGLLTSIVNASNYTKWVSNQQCKTQPTLISLSPNEYTQGIHYYPFAINLDRFFGSCNTVSELFNRVHVPNKTEDLNLSVFNMITGINESKKLTKHISCKCKCKFDGIKCNDRCRCECKNPKEHNSCEKDYIWNPAIRSCKNGKYLGNITHDSVATCDEFIKETKTVIANFNEKR